MDGQSGIVLTLASEVDIPAIVSLVKEFVAHTPYSTEDIEDEYLTNFVKGYVHGDGRVTTLITLKADDTVVGFLAGLVNDTHPLFSKVKIASELAWYVTKDHRGHGKLLLDAFEMWAKIMGCKYATVSDIPQVTDLQKFYEKNGYKQTERSYLKVL